MRYQGQISSWKDDKGFGFITPNGGGDQVFVHINAFTNRQRRPEGSELVTYEVTVDDRGRSQARGVSFVGERPVRFTPPGRSYFPPIFAACFLCFVGAAVFVGLLPPKVLALYLGASVVCYIAYAYDKSAALKNQWRTKESTLHLFALVGGWPGALAAQRVLRHKSAKASFQMVFWATVVLNCGALGWLFLPAGAKALRSMLGAA